MKITLSPSTLSLFLECPRCFWMHVREGIKRPSLGFPSLPSGMDLVLKKHFDEHRRSESVPEELEGRFEGRLFTDGEKLRKWRSNAHGLRFTDRETGATLMGAVDDMFVTRDGRYAPIDFKTRGFPRKENTHRFYQYQMDIYTFLLEKNSLPPANFAILIFYHPVGVDERHNVIFDPDPVKIPVSGRRGERIFRDAVRCLLGEKPESSKNCEFCRWAEKVSAGKSGQNAQKDLLDF